jgi:hypothetical protein
MTPEERTQLDWLCNEIKDERNHERFLRLIRELNDLLQGKEHRLKANQPKPPEKSIPPQKT